MDQSLQDSLRQLKQARLIVLKDPKLFPTIVGAILPNIAPETSVECRRWGGEFLTEAFGTPAVSLDDKEAMSLSVLSHIRAMIESPNQDAEVLKSTVQVAASMYPLVFKWIISNPFDTQRWDDLMAIKSKIYKIWDTAPIGVRICCIKFAQKLVLVQTPAPEDANRRADPADISASMVPTDHPLIPFSKLGAEAAGILDRMLSAFHEHATDAVLINATLNALAIVIRARPALSKTIINAILNFNPLKLANSPMTPKNRVLAKSMEKTTRSLIYHLLRRDPGHPQAARMDQYAKRLEMQRHEIFNRPDNKRGPPEPTDGLDDAKRQKLGANVAVAKPRLIVPPLAPAKNHTAAELYTITDDVALKSFDVGTLPADLVCKIVLAILPKIDADLLDQATEGVLARHDAMVAPPPPPPPPPPSTTISASTALLGVDVDEDPDFDPQFEVAEDTEQILNKLDNAPPERSPEREKAERRASSQALAVFSLEPPKLHAIRSATEHGQQIVTRILGMMAANDQSKAIDHQPGFNRLASVAHANGVEGWSIIAERLATRYQIGLQAQAEAMIKYEQSNNLKLDDYIRELLYSSVMEDFRLRMPLAISWLCEEWMNDQIASRMSVNPVLHYEQWALRILDGIIPYLDSKDKVLTRFVGEIPHITEGMISRIMELCRNPEMISLSIMTLFYVASMKPPAREAAMDAMQDVYSTYEEARSIAEKPLNRYRPEFLQRHRQIEAAPVGNANGISGDQPMAEA